jgi:hypothetical protein
MSAERRVLVDTNILVYAYDRAEGECRMGATTQTPGWIVQPGVSWTSFGCSDT